MTTRKQRGVALLVVLILLVLMSALAAKISQQFCRNLQKTRYQTSQQQLRWAIQSQLDGVKAQLQTETGGENKALSLEGEWHEPIETKGEYYTVVSQIEDAQTCFNLNSLAAAEPAPVDPTAAVPEKPVKQQTVEQLLIESGLNSGNAQEVYEQLVDYLDGDSTTVKEAQESDAWAGVTPARQPANQMMRTLSELKLLPAFPPRAYAKASRLLCVLPDVESRVDVNTLQPEQASLLAALFPGKMTTDEAARLIDLRPAEGWESVEAFSKTLESALPQCKEDLAQVAERVAVNSRYFRVNSTGNTDDLTLRVVSQLHVDNEAGEVTMWQRRYRMVE